MRLSRFSFICAVWLAGVGVGLAQNASEPTANAKEAATFPLKTRSSFNVEPGTRTPFWPVGWTKQAAATTQEEKPQVVLDESMFSITSILVGNPSLAIINGRTYSEGEFLRVPKDPAGSKAGTTTNNGKGNPLPPNVRIRVHRISDGNVTLQGEGQMIVVALRRPELPDKKPAEELLNDQR